MADPASTGRLDRPPSPDRIATLPSSLRRRYLLCVDTEEEFDWADRRRWHLSGVSAAAAIPAAHRRFRAAGAAVTYLADYPIVADDAAVGALGETIAAGGATIGAQLHPWVNPPLPPDTADSSFAGALPPELEEAKLAALAARIATAFGVRPLAYRAGRYGVGPRSAAALVRQGFALDLSVRPLFDYAAEGGPDFTDFGGQPFWAGEGRRLLAVPLGSALTGHWRRLGGGWYRRFGRVPPALAVLARLKLLARVALTPEGMPIADALEAARALLGEGVPLLSLSFHSPSLVPGNTPYVRDAAALADFWRWWDAIFAFLAREGVEPVSTDALAAFVRGGEAD
ncbi:WalW protein [Sphingomonas flavalba]|uniref:WalW protein n=1 Tax=Sphingomonas flavalba TaxID=2559804 RepID=UPI00109E2B9B|nr:WalW protein [Sphingomonas flavalba]